MGIEVATAVFIGSWPLDVSAGTTIIPPPTPVSPIRTPVAPLRNAIGHVEIMSLTRLLRSVRRAIAPANNIAVIRISSRVALGFSLKRNVIRTEVIKVMGRQISKNCFAAFQSIPPLLAWPRVIPIFEMKANALPDAIAITGSMLKNVIRAGITKTPAPTPDQRISSEKKNPAVLAVKLIYSMLSPLRGNGVWPNGKKCLG